jgi:hypothetical protein
LLLHLPFGILHGSDRHKTHYDAMSLANNSPIQGNQQHGCFSSSWLNPLSVLALLRLVKLFT